MPIAIYIVNGLVAGGTFVLVAMGKVSWYEATAFVAVMLLPSAAHVAHTEITK